MAVRRSPWGPATLGFSWEGSKRWGHLRGSCPDSLLPSPSQAGRLLLPPHLARPPPGVPQHEFLLRGQFLAPDQLYRPGRAAAVAGGRPAEGGGKWGKGEPGGRGGRGGAGKEQGWAGSRTSPTRKQGKGQSLPGCEQELVCSDKHPHPRMGGLALLPLTFLLPAGPHHWPHPSLPLPANLGVELLSHHQQVQSASCFPCCAQPGTSAQAWYPSCAQGSGVPSKQLSQGLSRVRSCKRVLLPSKAGQLWGGTAGGRG